MSGWKEHSGHAIALPIHNVDTDQLIPARFMSTPRSEGYGRFLLHDLRRDSGGEPHPHFPLNRHRHATILVTGRNFGSGSSREAAVYALVDAGVKAVFAPSFGDIFAGNAVNNGLLPARISEDDMTVLFQSLEDTSKAAWICLEASHLTIGDTKVAFSLDPSWGTKLIKGWDDIDLTIQHALRIEHYKQNLKHSAPWVWPSANNRSS